LQLSLFLVKTALSTYMKPSTTPSQADCRQYARGRKECGNILAATTAGHPQAARSQPRGGHGCTPSARTFMLYTVSDGFGPSPCRTANRVPCKSQSDSTKDGGHLRHWIVDSVRDPKQLMASVNHHVSIKLWRPHRRVAGRAAREAAPPWAPRRSR